MGDKKERRLERKGKDKERYHRFCFLDRVAALYYRRSCDAGNGKMVYGK